MAKKKEQTTKKPGHRDILRRLRQQAMTDLKKLLRHHALADIDYCVRQLKENAKACRELESLRLQVADMDRPEFLVDKIVTKR